MIRRKAKFKSPLITVSLDTYTNKEPIVEKLSNFPGISAVKDLSLRYQLPKLLSLENGRARAL